MPTKQQAHEEAVLSTLEWVHAMRHDAQLCLQASGQPIEDSVHPEAESCQQQVRPAHLTMAEVGLLRR